MTSKPSQSQIDLDRLLKLRLVVARHGEMDAAKWWNTQGMLGRRGGIVLKRGFPSTHAFAQARVVFAVAKTRCNEIFDPPGSMTLWNLPPEIEDQFEEHWQVWLDQSATWAPVFEAIEAQTGEDLLQSLRQLELLTESQVAAVNKLRRSAENRAVPISGTHSPTDDIITMLAAGFARGEKAGLAVPYARLEG
ncbi:MAG: BrxE family protein [Myxococcota bacterium]